MPKESFYQQHHRLAEPLNRSFNMQTAPNEDRKGSEDEADVIDTVRVSSNVGPTKVINVTRVMNPGARTCKAVK